MPDPSPTIEDFDLHAKMYPPLRTMLGCDWGTHVWTPDDPEPCPEQAVKRVRLYNPHGLPDMPPDGHELKFCAVHHRRVQEETDPHRRTRHAS